MTLAEFKSQIESYRKDLREKTGICCFSEAGPVGMSLIDALVPTLEEHERRIEDLEKRGSP